MRCVSRTLEAKAALLDVEAALDALRLAVVPRGGDQAVNTTLEAASQFLRHGCSVIPLRPHDKRPAMPWAEFQRRRATNPELIGWWGGSSRLGLAVVCGRVSALAVVDVDPRHGGRQSLDAYPVPAGPTVRTGGGGEHYYLATAATLPKVPALLPGVDLQAEGSYVVAPPSLHPNGTRYAWALGRGLGEVPLPAVPVWLRRMIQLHQGRPPVTTGTPGDVAPQMAPPPGGKTEVIRSLDDVSDVFPLSSLSAQTFASGFEKRGAETSLLPKLDGKTIVMKDFGTVLTMYREKKAEILAQLREIYDGSFAKEWGNGKSLKWNGKVGLLAGVTGIIDREYSLNQVLGERFLLYRLKRAPARALARAALAQRQREADQRRALRLVVAEFLDQLPLVPAELPPAITEALAALAEFAALARSPVFFDARGEVELVPEPGREYAPPAAAAGEDRP